MMKGRCECGRPYKIENYFVNDMEVNDDGLYTEGVIHCACGTSALADITFNVSIKEMALFPIVEFNPN